ncbi:glycosyltransferase family 2 protein [Trueperella bernardiae]|uniref:glycosyltransferase family 2 protein n=1 Tax=Trueperella bernardiae TaxID=59561 RepID=UPI00288B22D2|nr:glycosyltransferase [Trueperella bernardiae]
MESVTREKVTAIVVCHRRDLSFLADTLVGLREQIHGPDHIVVAVPSLDSPFVQPVHAQLDPDGEHIQLVHGAGKNLGQVIAGLELPESDWLWILHADSRPEPAALDTLLRTGEGSNRIGVVGPKQIAWEDADSPVLLEVGIRATRSARRVPEVEAGERDQGQYDSRIDVLAVGTAGALVRRSMWDELGGLDPFLGPFGEGLEFSRRARRAGYRVVVDPAAVVRHARAGLGENPDRSYAQRRSAQIYNSLLAAPGALVPLYVLGYLLLALPRSLARLVTKDTALAWAELGAGARVLTMLDDVVRGRRRIAKVASVGADALTALEARPADIRSARRESKRSAKEAKILAEQPDPLTIKARADLARHSRRGGLVSVAIAALVAVVFFLPVFSAGVLSGGGLAADTTGAPDLARLIWSGWLDSGSGHAYAVDPLWVAMLPFLVLGRPFGLTLGALATGMLYLAIPAAAFFAYLAAGRMSASWVVRTVAALAWVVAPPFMAALADGQIGAVVVHVTLPVALFAIAGAWRGSARSLGLLALAFGVLAAATPLFAAVAIVVAVIGVAGRPGQRKRWLWVPVPALLLLAPSLGAFSPGLLFAQPGVPTGATPALVMVDQVRTDPVLLVAVASVFGAAALALLRLHRRWWIRLGWLILAAGLGVAALAPTFTVGYRLVTGGYESVEGSPIVGYSLAWLGAWIAIICGSHGLRTAMRRRSFGATQIVGGLVMLALPLAVVAAGGRGLQTVWEEEPVLGANAPALPALGVEAEARHERVLALTPTSEGVSAELWRGQGIELHEYTMARGQAMDPDSADSALADAVAGLTRGSGDGAELADHAIAIVLVPPAGEGESPEFRSQLVGRLHTIPGLQYVTTGEAGTFWRVTEPADRARADAGLASGVVNAEGEVTGPGTLSLAERADARWVATLDGQRLETIEDSWAQAWQLPDAGDVHIDYVDRVHRVTVVAQFVALLASLVTALPLRRRVGGIE